MATSVAPISDREVGGLQNIPLSPHRQLTRNHPLSRSDPDISQTSAAVTPSVPRSSSFTRSKRFLTGDGLSAREALGLLDNPGGPPIESESVRLVQSFDIARSAMNEIFGATAPHVNHSPPPPPKVLTSGDENKLKRASTVPAAPPPPPPPPPLLSRLVFGENAITSPQKSESTTQLSPSPPSAQILSTAMHAELSPPVDDHMSTSPSSPIASDKSKPRVRRGTSPTSREAKFAKGSHSPPLKKNAAPSAGTEAPGSSPHSISMPRSKSISRFFGLFSPSHAHSADNNAVEDATDTAVAASKYDTVQSASDNIHGKKSSRPLPLLRRVSGPVPSSDGNRNVMQRSAAKSPQLIDRQPSEEVAKRNQEMFTSDDDSSLSNIADLVVREQPLFPRESRSTSTATRGDGHGDAREEGNGNRVYNGAVSRVPDAKSVVPPPNFSSNSRATNKTDASVDTTVQASTVTTPVNADVNTKSEYVRRRMDLFKKFKAIEDYIKHDLDSMSYAEHMPQNPNKDSCRKPEMPTVGVPVQPAFDKSTPKEGNPASSVSSRVRNEQSSVPNDDDVSFTSAPEDLPDIHGTYKSTLEESKSPKMDDESDFEKSPKSSVESPTVESMTTSSSSQSRKDRFCEHPGPAGVNPDVYHLRGGGVVDFSGALVDESLRPSCQFPLSMLPSNGPSGVNAHGFMNGPVMEAVIEENSAVHRARRDSHAAFLQTLADSRDNEHSQQVENKAEPQVGMRKTKSGLRQRIVATAKKLPRGRSFPRLRSWGDATRSECKPAERSKSLSRQTKDRSARNEEANRKGGKKSTQRTETTECKLKGKAVDENVGKTSQPRIVCVEEGTSSIKEMQPDTTELWDEKPVGHEEKKVEAKTMTMTPLINGTRNEKIGGKSRRGDNEMTHNVCQIGLETGKDGLLHSKAKTPDSGGLTREEQSTAKAVQMSQKTKAETAAEASCAVASEIPDASSSNALNDVTRERARTDAQQSGRENCDKTKNETRRSNSGFASSKEGSAPMVTIERVIRRTKADGSSETVRKKIRVRPERVLANGDVVVKRTLQRMKEDGSGTETMTVMQVIARRRKEKECRDNETVGMKVGLAAKEGKRAEGFADMEYGKLGDTVQGGQRETEGRSDCLSRKGSEGKEKAEGKEGEIERERGGWKRVWLPQGNEGGGKWVWRQ